MSLISSVPPNGTISGPLPGAAVQATALINAATGTVQAARSLLPSAVLASTVVPTYQEPRLLKTTLRSSNNAPSSPLAAQMIASGTITEEELAIFNARTPTTSTPTTQQETSPADDFLAALRQARGDAAPLTANGNAPASVTAAPTQAAQTTAQTVTTNILNFATATAGLPTPTRPTLSSDARGLPQLANNITGRKPGLGLARGADAYQLAETRNYSNALISAGVDASL